MHLQTISSSQSALRRAFDKVLQASRKVWLKQLTRRCMPHFGRVRHPAQIGRHFCPAVACHTLLKHVHSWLGARQPADHNMHAHGCAAFCSPWQESRAIKNQQTGPSHLQNMLATAVLDMYPYRRAAIFPPWQASQASQRQQTRPAGLQG